MATPTITFNANLNLTQGERQIADFAKKAQAKIRPISLAIDDKNFRNALGRITGDVSEFDKSLAASNARVIAFGASVGIINSISNSFKELVKQTINVEKVLTDISVIYGTTGKELDNFKNRIFETARTTASSFDVTSKAALEFSRQGLSLEETLKRTRDALILTRFSTLDFDKSVEALTATVNGFSDSLLSTTEVVNKFVALDNAFAVSSKDLADSLSRSASSAQDAGVSFESLLAITTTLQQRTARGGAVIGNALKTIFTRISGEGTIRQLRELGVEIDGAQNSTEKLRAIAQRVSEVDSVTANKIREIAAGVRQVNILSALLRDLTSEYSLYESALTKANSATDDAVRRNELLNQTLDALSKQGLASFEELVSKIGDIALEDNLKSVLSLFKNLLSDINTIIDGEGIGSDIANNLVKGFGNALGPIAILLTSSFVKILSQSALLAKDLIKEFSLFNTNAEKNRALQAQIERLISASTEEYKEQLLLASSKEDKERLIAKLLSEQVNRQKQLNALYSEYANLARGAGFATERGGRLVQRKVPNAADGYIPAFSQESSAIKSGVGGANRNDSPKLIKDFNFGGRRGPIMANTGEKLIRNFLGSGSDAVFNRKMIESVGGIQNLKILGKIENVAGGYIPNFANPRLIKSGLAKEIGTGSTGTAFELKNKNLITKKIGKTSDIEVEYLSRLIGSKLLSGGSVNILPPIGSLKRSIERGYVGGNKVENIKNQNNPLAQIIGNSINLFLRAKIKKNPYLKDIFKDIAPDVHSQNFGMNERASKILDGIYSRNKNNPKRLKEIGSSISNYLFLKRGNEEKFLSKFEKAGARFDIFDPFYGNPNTSFSKKSLDFIGKIKTFSQGFIPNYEAIQNAAQREIEALVSIGVPEEQAKKAIRIDSAPILKNAKNPSGFGIYNSIQETSLADAFGKHSRGGTFKAQAFGVPNYAIDYPDYSALLFGGGGDLDELNREQLRNIVRSINQTTKSNIPISGDKGKLKQRILGALSGGKVSQKLAAQKAIVSQFGKQSVGIAGSAPVSTPPQISPTVFSKTQAQVAQTSSVFGPQLREQMRGKGAIPKDITPEKYQQKIKKNLDLLPSLMRTPEVIDKENYKKLLKNLPDRIEIDYSLFDKLQKKDNINTPPPTKEQLEKLSKIPSTSEMIEAKKKQELNQQLIEEKKYTDSLKKTALEQDALKKFKNREVLTVKELTLVEESLLKNRLKEIGISKKDLQKSSPRQILGLASKIDPNIETSIAKEVQRVNQEVRNVEAKRLRELRKQRDFINQQNRERPFTDFKATVNQKYGDQGFAGRSLLQSAGSFFYDPITRSREFKGLTRSQQEEIRNQRDRARNEKITNAGFGIAVGASFAQPFIQNSAFGQTGVGSTLSGALTGLSFGSFLGPKGIAIGAVAGAAVGLANALDTTTKNFEKFNKTAEDIINKNQNYVSSLNSFLQAQSQFTGLIQSGADRSQIDSASKIVQDAFLKINNTTVRSDILGARGDIEAIQEIIAKQERLVQAENERVQGLQAGLKSRVEESGGLTRFFKGDTSLLNIQDINLVARSLTSTIQSLSKDDFANFEKILKSNAASVNDLSSVLKLTGEESENLKQILGDNQINLRDFTNALKGIVDGSKVVEDEINRLKKSLFSLQETKSAINQIDFLKNSLFETSQVLASNAFGLNEARKKAAFSLANPNVDQLQARQFESGLALQRNEFERTAQIESVIRSLRSGLSEELSTLIGSTDQQEIGKLVPVLEKFVKEQVGFDEFKSNLEFIGANGENLNENFKKVSNSVQSATQNLIQINSNTATQNALIETQQALFERQFRDEARRNVFGGARGLLSGSDTLENFRNRDILGQFSDQESRRTRAFGIAEAFDLFKNVPELQNKITQEDLGGLTSEIAQQLSNKLSDLNIKLSDSEFNSLLKSYLDEFKKSELKPEDFKAAVLEGMDGGFSKFSETQPLFKESPIDIGIIKNNSQDILGAIRGLERKGQVGKAVGGLESERKKLLTEKNTIESQIKLGKVNTTANELKFKARPEDLLFGTINNNTLTSEFSEFAEKFLEKNFNKDGRAFGFDPAGNRLAKEVANGGDLKSLERTLIDSLGKELRKGGFLTESARGSGTQLNEKGLKLLQELVLTFPKSSQILDKDTLIKIINSKIDGQKKDKETEKLSNELKDINEKINAIDEKIKETLEENGGGKKIDTSLTLKKAFDSLGARIVSIFKGGNSLLKEAIQKIVEQNKTQETETPQPAPETNQRRLFEAYGNQGFSRLLGSELRNELQSRKENLGVISRTEQLNLANDFALQERQLDVALKFGDIDEASYRQLKQALDTRKKELEDAFEIKITADTTGFRTAIEGLRQGFRDLQIQAADNGPVMEAWARVPGTITSSLSSAIVSNIQNYKQLKQEGVNVWDAIGNSFRKMMSDMFAQLAQMYMNRAFMSMFGSILPGLGPTPTGYSGGGSIPRYANGGMTGSHTPALVMGGEYAFAPQVVSAFGLDFMESLNRGDAKINDFVSTASSGGPKMGDMITGGSGTKDDVFGRFPSGTYILRKSAVGKYGKQNLDKLSAMAGGGQIKKAAWGAILGQIVGGMLQGAVVGGLTAAITGNDIGMGALLGGIGGGLAGGITGAMNPSGGGFMGGFKNSFSWMGLGGSKAPTPTVGTGATSATGSQVGGAFYGNNQISMTPASISSPGTVTVGGYTAGATGFGPTAAIGNVAVPAAGPTGFFNKFGSQLLMGGAMLGASALLMPSSSGSGGTKIIKGDSSTTIVHSDGTVEIEKYGNNSGKEKYKLGQDMSVEELNSWLATQGAQNYDPNEIARGIQGLAEGGVIKDLLKQPENEIIKVGTGRNPMLNGVIKSSEQQSINQVFDIPDKISLRDTNTINKIIQKGKTITEKQAENIVKSIINNNNSSSANSITNNDSRISSISNNKSNIFNSIMSSSFNEDSTTNNTNSSIFNKMTKSLMSNNSTDIRKINTFSNGGFSANYNTSFGLGSSKILQDRVSFNNILEKNSVFEKSVMPLIMKGSGLKDDVPIMAKRGEFVLKNSAVSKYGVGTLMSMNTGRMEPQKIKMLAEGGPVSDSMSSGNNSGIKIVPSDSLNSNISTGIKEESNKVDSGSGNVYIDININIDSSGNASDETSVSGGNQDRERTIEFQNKLKFALKELIRNEKRPGGMLSKDASNI